MPAIYEMASGVARSRSGDIAARGRLGKTTSEHVDQRSPPRNRPSFEAGEASVQFQSTKIGDCRLATQFSFGWCSLLMCTQQGRTGGIATRLYVDSRIIRISGRDDGRGRERSPGDSTRAAWRTPIHLQRLWTTHRPGAIDSGADLGGSAVGGAPRDARLRAAASRLSVVRDPDRAHRVRGSEGARETPPAAHRPR